MSSSDFETERRLKALEDAGGFSHASAEIELGLRDTPDGMQDPPKQPAQPYKPHPTGHVRGEPGTPGGNDVGRGLAEAWSRENPDYGVPRPAHLGPEKRKTEGDAPIGDSIRTARFDLTTCLSAYRVGFIPQTRVEISDIMLFGGKSSSIALGGLYKKLNSVSQADTPERIAVKTERAQGAVKGVVERLVQHLGDARRDHTALIALLQQQSSGEKIDDELLITAQKAYVRYLDLTDLKDGNLAKLSFDPLVTHIENVSEHKQIIDVYHNPKKAEKVDAHVTRRIGEGVQKNTIILALADTSARGRYCRDRLREANAYPWIKAIAQGVFDVLDVRKPN